MMLGGIHLIYSFSDYQQLTPVGIKPISDLTTTPKVGSSDLQGLLMLNEFLNYSESGTIRCTFVMDEVVRQDNR